MNEKQKKEMRRITPMFSTEGLPPGFRYIDFDSDGGEAHRAMFPRRTPPPRRPPTRRSSLLRSAGG